MDALRDTTGTTRCTSATFGRMPIPTTPDAVAWAEYAMSLEDALGSARKLRHFDAIVEALEKLAKDPECGCRSSNGLCTGSCMGTESLSIELAERISFARTALAAYENDKG